MCGNEIIAVYALLIPSKDSLLNFLIEHMPNPEGLPAEDLHSQYETWISQPKHWKE